MTMFALSVPASCAIVVALGVMLLAGMISSPGGTLFDFGIGSLLLLTGLTVPISLCMAVKSTQ